MFNKKWNVQISKVTANINENWILGRYLYDLAMCLDYLVFMRGFFLKMLLSNIGLLQ